MAHQKRSFDPKRLDDEIEHLMRIEDSDDLADSPDARLIDDLQHALQSDGADVESLARVYTRLQAHKHRIRTTAHASGRAPFPMLHPSQKGWISLKSSMTHPDPVTDPGEKSAKSSRSRFAAAAGVLMVGVLLIGAIWLFNGMHAQKTATSKQGVAHPGTTHLDIHNGNLLCSTSYDKNWPIFLARPKLSWSATGMLADQHGSLRTFDPKTCTEQSASWTANAVGLPVWSPDGKRLLLFGSSSYASGTAQVLDATTGQTLATMKLERTKSQVAAFIQAAWTPDGTQIVTVALVSYDSHTTSTIAIQVWNASTGALIRTVKTASVYSGGATVSPNGKYFALETPDQHLQFWDVTTGQMISAASSDLHGFGDPTWSPDGASLAISVGSPTWPDAPAEVYVYASASAQRIASFADSDTFEGNIDAMAWSPDGRYLAEGGHAINIWDIKTQKLAATFGKINPDTTTTNGVKTSYLVAGLVWSPDGHMLASVTGSDPWDASSPLPDQKDTLNVWKLS